MNLGQNCQTVSFRWALVGQTCFSILPYEWHDCRMSVVLDFALNPCFFCREDFRDLEGLKPSDDAINARLTTPAVATMLNTDNIAFTR